MENLTYLSTDTEIIAYWDLPFYEGERPKFTVSLNGETRTTEKTHCKFTGLEPETEYTLKVSDTLSGNSELKCITKLTRKRLDITDFGAVGDGVTLNTKAIQAAIDACSKGEQVYVPKGNFLTGALRLHSDMELYVEKDGVLQGTSAVADYSPKIKSRFEGIEMECFQSLLNLGELDHTSGPNCENVIIRGEGTIYGGGADLAKNIAKSEEVRLKDFIASLGDRIKEYEKPETVTHRARGRLINMSNCRNIWIHGLTIGKSPSWNVHFIYSDGIVTDECIFESQGIWNGDGWDPDSSENSTIFNCRFFTEDDSVAIKSGKNPEGNVINRPTKNIRIFDCVTEFGHGLCMGSEMSGGIDTVKIWDCEMGPTWSGIEIKGTKKRGGYVRNLEVRNVVTSHVQLHSVGYNDDGIGASEPPVFENCLFKDMHILGRYLDNNSGRNEWHPCAAIDLQGFDEDKHAVNNVRFENIEIENSEDDALGSIRMKYCKNVSFKDIRNA